MTVFAAILHGSETVRKAGTAVKSADKANRRYTEESCVSGFGEAMRSFHVCRSDGTFGRAIGGIAAIMIFRKRAGASGSFWRMRRKHEDERGA